MIIKKGDRFFSVEKIMKKNVFSDSRKGNIFLHSKLVYCNCVLLPKVKGVQDVEEVTLCVSERGAFDFRSSGCDFLNIPIQGDFILDLEKGQFNRLLDHSYHVLASIHERSRRRIKTWQLDEIRRNSDYDIEFEDDFYHFLKLAECQIEYINEFHLYDLTKLELLKDILKDFDIFYLKIPTDSIESVGRGQAKCGIRFQIYKTHSQLAEILKKKLDCITVVAYNGTEYKVKYISSILEEGYIGVEIEDSNNIVYLALDEGFEQEFEHRMSKKRNLHIKIPKFILN